MSDQMYREVILDHYKNPRGHGVIEDADAEAEGFNPLCGDEVSIYVSFADDGETIEDVKFSGRGCAISQAATSMLVDMAKGRKATDLAQMPKDELLGSASAECRSPRAARPSASPRADAEGRAARGDRHSADADPAQVR